MALYGITKAEAEEAGNLVIFIQLANDPHMTITLDT